MLFHGAGAVGRIAVRGQEIPAYAAPPSVNDDFSTSLPGGWTFTRASANATNCTYLDGNTQSTYTTYAANAPRFLAFGLLIEPSRTNLFLNSEAPVTQTITVVPGNVVVWMLGTGSVTVAAGTAVGTGYGVATAGSFVLLTIGLGGTITVTCTAPVTRVQVEVGTAPSSYIPTTAAAATRADDRLSKVYAAGVLNVTEATYQVSYCVPGATDGTKLTLMNAGVGSYSSVQNTDALSYTVAAGHLGANAGVAGSGVAVSPSDASSALLPGAIARNAMSVSLNRCVAAADGVIGNVGNPNLRPNAITTITLGGGGVATAAMNGFLRAFRYWPTALSNEQLQTITKAGYFRTGPVFDFDLKQTTLPRRMSFYRDAGQAGATVTDALPTDAAGSTYNTYGVASVLPSLPRTHPQGILLEPARNSYIPGSNVPATKATINLPNSNNYMLWVTGTGSATLSAGTAVPTAVSGSSVVTQGNPCIFTVDILGNVNLTLTGTLNRWQIEQIGSISNGVPSWQSPTSFIQYSSGSSSRGTDYLSMPVSNWHNANEYTYFIEATLLGRFFNGSLLCLYNLNTERETVQVYMPDGQSTARSALRGDKLAGGSSYGWVLASQNDIPLNTPIRIAYSGNGSKRSIVLNGIVGQTLYSNGPNVYPTQLLVNGLLLPGSPNGSGMFRARRVQMYDYAMTQDEMASLTAGAGEALDLDFMQPGTMPAGMTFTRTSVGTYFDSAGVMQTAATGVARWDYDPVTHALRGLLIEEARTNSSLQSGDFTNASWNKANCTLAAGIAGPNGATTGSGVISNNGVFGYLTQNHTTVAGTTYTVSCFFKAGSLTTTQILMPSAFWNDAVIRVVTFDLSLGIVLTVAGGGASGTITPVGNGWYRCSMIATPDKAVTAAVQFGRATTNGDGVTTQHYAWGAQIEIGAFATSYIPTTTVAVTRIKELLTMPAGSFGSMFTGTMFVEGMQMGLWSKPATYFAISTVGKLGFIVQAGNQLAYFENLGLNQQMGEVPTGRPFKAAFSFTPTAQSSALDGVLSLANSYALPATTRSTIVVGTDTNVQQPNGYIRRAKIWTRTMPDDELIALTR